MYVRRKREKGTQTEAAPTQRPASAAARAAPQTSGAPLEHGTREFMEQRFGHDFSRVRVHTDSDAASSAKSANAQAYTVRNNVVFGSGQYNPESPSWKQLLAHELTHVVQQDKPSTGMAQAADYEAEASAASGRIAKGERASVTLAAPPVMQKQALPGTAPAADLTESASPIMASAIGSVTLDGFETGKADISADNRTKLSRTADTIIKLFKKYPASTIRVIGYTDAVGQESDNQVLGRTRADSVQAALLDMGVPGVSVKTESRGATEPVVKSKKSEPRNRRVEVRFEPSRLLHGAFSQGLTLSPSLTQPTAPPPPGGGVKVGTSITDLCITTPSLCQVTPGEPPKVPEAALKPIPDDTPFELMDVQALAETSTSHGSSPQDLRATWAAAYWKYRRAGLSKELAAKAANWELNNTLGKGLSRDLPNAADRLDKEMQQGYPGATKVGPASITVFKF
jgi:outer membrane protein OmpA-like peptidoglycan-associated protein